MEKKIIAVLEKFGLFVAGILFESLCGLGTSLSCRFFASQIGILIALVGLVFYIWRGGEIRNKTWPLLVGLALETQFGLGTMVFHAIGGQGIVGGLLVVATVVLLVGVEQVQTFLEKHRK